MSEVKPVIGRSPRRWLSIVALIAMVLEPLLLAAAVGAVSVDLTRQLDSASAAPAMTVTAAERGTLPPAPQSPGHGIPYCPFWSCSFDLAHAAGSVPVAAAAGAGLASVPAVMRTVPNRALPAVADRSHAARGPPSAALA
jgi:hypothetical protein